ERPLADGSILTTQQTSSPMRVGLVVRSLEPGGVETFVFRLSLFLAKRGHQVDIVVTESKGRWFDRAAELGINTRLLELRGFSSARKHAEQVGRQLAGLRYDVCFFNHTRLAQAAMAVVPDSTVIIPILHNDSDYVYSIGCANQSAWNVAVAVSERVLQTAKLRVADKPVVLIHHG